MTEASTYRQKYQNQIKMVKDITIKATPLYSVVPTNTCMEMPVLFQILVGDLSEKLERNPMHICLVLDRSGSMEGKPLERSKKAIRQLIKKLGPNDLVSLVIYDNRVETVFVGKKATDYNNLVPMIEAVQHRDTTNISGGLEKATDILTGRVTTEHPPSVTAKAQYAIESLTNTILSSLNVLANNDKTNPSVDTKTQENCGDKYQKLVFLFSDGVANAGITNLNKLGEKIVKWVETDNIRFNSFGIGNEYNEEWMKSIARGGEGVYYYIDDVEKIPEYVDKALNSYCAVIGQKANFQVSSIGENKVVSLQNDKTEATLTNGKNFPYLRCRGMYQYIANVIVKTGETSSKNDIVNYKLTFNPVKGLENLSSCNGTVQITTDNDMKKEDMKKNPEVICYMTIQECGELNHKVDDAMKVGDLTDAILIKSQITAKYKNIAQLDQFGIIEALLEQEIKALLTFQREGLSNKSYKTQGSNTSYGYSATSSATVSNWEHKKTLMVEEDGDASNLMS